MTLIPPGRPMKLGAIPLFTTSPPTFLCNFCMAPEYNCAIHSVSLSQAAHLLIAPASISKKFAKAIKQ